MSIFKTNKFFRVIKHFILALPLMFVLGVSLYAIVNPNAKDSYYGETINEILYEPVSNSSQLSVNTKFRYLGVDLSSYGYGNLTNTKFYFYSITYNNVTYENVTLTYYLTQGNITYSYLSYTGGSSIFNDIRNDNLYFEGIFNYYVTNLESTLLFSQFNYIVYNEYSYLNNAFEYGMYQFTNIGFGQFDFISLFNGIFTTNINNVYASFINDYINYYLFVEIIYFAPWVFHAFIHFAYDIGDYFTSSFKRNRKDDD